MRLCRYESAGIPEIGFYEGRRVISLARAGYELRIPIPGRDSLLPCLPGGAARDWICELQEKIAGCDEETRLRWSLPVEAVRLLVPVPAPSKLLLLAGNYAKHIVEGGGRAEERSKTFPYVFMKPPTTTLTPAGGVVRLPEVSPDHIDWEIELGVVIGRRCRGVSEGEALSYVAGYTVVNDISDRKYKPNPDRAAREKDGFFDWLHGKWHDTFCPMGPCVLPADECADPQNLQMTLKVNGEVKQNASTAEMVFPVAAVIEFISRSVTLEPGDVISTGTPSGVGAASKTFLRRGDRLDATIERIGTLWNLVE